MRTVKPLTLSILTRGFVRAGRQYLGVAGILFVPLDSSKTLFSEVDLWKTVPKELGESGVLDVGIPKERAEFLVCGKAYAPGGEPVPGLAVRARLGSIEKTLVVFGERYWIGAGISKPRPFVEMPLDWAHAYGGPDFAENPQGKGHRHTDGEQPEVRWLPNVESPASPLVRPDQKARPAGFGPVDAAWPQRRALSGTYGSDWLKQHFPALPPDADWRYFNAAPADQHFPGYLQGDETYLLEHMHPARPAIGGTLPGARVRCFVVAAGGEPDTLRELKTQLTTVWFFPAIERAVLVYHTVLQVADEAASDVGVLLGAVEALEAPRTTEHYQSVLRQRLDKEKGFLHALRERDLAPAGWRLEIDALMSMPEPTIASRRGRRKLELALADLQQRLTAIGADPATIPQGLPEMDLPKSLDELADYVGRKLAEAEAQQAESQRKAQALEQSTRELYGRLGLKYDDVKRHLRGIGSGPPRFSAERKIAEFQAAISSLGAAGHPAAAYEENIAGTGMYEKWRELERMGLEGYRRSAHLRDPALPMPDERRGKVHAYLAGVDCSALKLAGRDLTGADLSGLDLSGIDLAGALLESAKLDGAILDGADLSGAVLAHASLAGVRAAGADFRGANLGRARFGSAELHRCDLRDCVLAYADLRGASLRGSVLKGATLLDTAFGDTDLSEADCSQLMFVRCRLSGVRFERARLARASFIEVDLERASFAAANAEAATFVTAKLDGADCRQADFSGACFVEGTSALRADFTGARLDRANLRGCPLDGALFVRASLADADLSEAALNGADLRGALAKGARWIRADLSGAQGAAGNLMECLLTGADLRGARFDGANLFGADLGRVRVDAATRFDGALTTRVNTYPRAAADPNAAGHP
ncbi:MAG TPA: DUF2169 domain-containing protein [Rhodocyclaceae bacterium]|nr:DUF2169 domain-containing protein [Rhodocyclaceae bacterium]